MLNNIKCEQNAIAKNEFFLKIKEFAEFGTIKKK